ncbi:MAG TPA: ribosome maturation factor RimP [Wenzhouxiangellaceae bacterium]|nr:ribosome maturation factor RimP [Wenzhouxiangellaceae bacterium]
MSVQDDLSRLIRPTIEAMGFEFVGLEYLSNPKNRLVRIYIDREPEGISIDNCADVSNEVSALLDVEDPVSGHYSLEVSSPGIERPLFEPAHYRQFKGERAKVHLFAPVDASSDNDRDKRRKLTGRIIEADDERVVMDIDGDTVAILFDDIRRANLKPDMDEIMAGRRKSGSEKVENEHYE